MQDELSAYAVGCNGVMDTKMKFHSLTIKNLRAIRLFEVDDLNDFVVVAGQNGSGKSCVFDAIRLLKSVYGGYSANEYHQWFGEFAINLQDTASLKKLFRHADRAIEISAKISFDGTEVDYISKNAEQLVRPLAWQSITGQAVDYWTFTRMAVATQLRENREQLTRVTAAFAADVRNALANKVHVLSLEILPSGEMRTSDCKPAEAAFQAYQPDFLGIIEYHSASRSYARQQVGQINLDTRAFEDQQRQHRLYNWQSKYQHIKTELATSYLRRMISAQAEGPQDSSNDLNETLKELFKTFFPDKTYEGVTPQSRGGLEFPVRLSTGETHDIDELSSGEKEILYGYLRLKNSTPKHSVILLDEPELHMNPSLLQGFTDFYHRHIGRAQGNQLWLVTHSDTLLRQAVGNSNYRVYQMVPATALPDGKNQAVEILADDDVERVTIELVGDLASYRPHGKVVILEGRSENGFDVNMVRRLFPEFARRVNLVSGGNKARVRDLYSALREAAAQAGIRNRFFAVVDKDFSEHLSPEDAAASEFSWDVYHIENYLLDSGCIRAATAALLGNDVFDSDNDVTMSLRSCADELLDSLVLELLQKEVNALLIGSVKVAGPPDTKSPAVDLLPSIIGSIERLSAVQKRLELPALETMAECHRKTLDEALKNDTWRLTFPGRSLMRRFAGKHLAGRVEAGIFLNSVLDKMVERTVKPASMKRVLDDILAK